MSISNSMIRSLRDKYLASKFSRDTVWLILAQITLMGAGFLVNLLVGKFEGTDDLGVFNQALAYYTILSTLFTFGLNNALIKKIAEQTRDEQAENRLFSANIVLTFALSLLLTAVSLTVISALPGFLSSPELADVLYIPLLGLPLFNVNKNFMAYYSGRRDQRKFSLERIIRWVVIAIVVGVACIAGLGVSVALCAFPIAEGVLFLFNCIDLRHRFDFAFNRGELSENLSFGMKSYVAEIISVFSSTFDLILIGYFISNEEAGIYSFIVFFVKTLYIFPGILMQNLSPVISNLWATNQFDQLSAKIARVRKINAGVLTVQLLLLLLGYWLIILFMKQEFQSSYVYFLIAIGGVYIFALISWSGTMLVMTGKLNENIARTTLIIVFSVASTIVLSKLFGLTGACAALSLNGILAFLMTRGFVYRVLKIRLI